MLLRGSGDGGADPFIPHCHVCPGLEGKGLGTEVKWTDVSVHSGTLLLNAGLLLRDRYVCPQGKAKLSEVEVDFDLQCNIDGFAVAHSGPEPPLGHGFNSLVVETKSEAPAHSDNFDRSVSAYDGLQDDRSLVFCLAGLFRVLGQDL